MLAVNEHAAKVAHHSLKFGCIVDFDDRYRSIVLLDRRRVGEEWLPVFVVHLIGARVRVRNAVEVAGRRPEHLKFNTPFAIPA